MQKNFTLSLLAVALLALTATVAAQDANNPWHVVAFEGDKEVAFYNTEVITAIEATTQTVSIILANGKKFTHPTATITFGFDPRRNGTATVNKNLTFPQWHVYYANGSLHFSEPVSGVAVYSLAGALVAKYAGFYTEVPLTLPQGLYIIQANGQSAKLPVSANGTGSTTAQPATTETPTTTYTPDLQGITLHAATIKIYWNITAGNSTTAVEIPNVEKFHFTTDNSIVFTLKNGNTMELADYKGVEFAVEPALVTTTSKWDLEKTLKFGGASYSPVNQGKEMLIVFALLSKNDVLIHTEYFNGTLYENATVPINSTLDFWNKQGRISVFYYKEELCPSFSCERMSTTRLVTDYMSLVNGDNIGTAMNDNNWAFNNNTNIIYTTITQNANGSVTMSCVDHQEKIISFTFTDW